MMARLRLWASALILAAAAKAHFTLDYPATAGFDEDSEPNAPCGGASIDKAPTTDFHVGGDNIATNLLHPQGTWLYRATLDLSASGNWTSVFPTVLQSGLGKFCEPMISVPSTWAGKTGVVGVVVDAPDGLLYQCAKVNFVSGSAGSKQSTCTNSSSVSASFTGDKALASVAGAPSATSGGSGGNSTSSGGGGSSSSSSTSKPGNAAPGRMGGDSLLFSNMLVVLFMVLMGAVYML